MVPDHSQSSIFPSARPTARVPNLFDLDFRLKFLEDGRARGGKAIAVMAAGE